MGWEAAIRDASSSGKALYPCNSVVHLGFRAALGNTLLLQGVLY